MSRGTKIKANVKEVSMKGLVQMVVLGALAVMMAAGSAFAAASKIFVDGNATDTSKSYTVSAEAVAAKDVYFSNSTGDLEATTVAHIYYNPAISLGDGNTITMTFSGGGIEKDDANNILVVHPNGTVVGSMVDFTLSDDGKYYTSALLKFNATVEAGTSVEITNGTNYNSTGIYPVMTKGADKLTAQVTEAKDSTGTSLSAPLTDATTVATTKQQVTAAVYKGTDTIDCEKESRMPHPRCSQSGLTTRMAGSDNNHVIFFFTG